MTGTQTENNKPGTPPVKVHCPQCWALIDWNAETCPQCRHMITLHHFNPPSMPVPFGSTSTKRRDYSPPRTITSTSKPNEIQRRLPGFIPGNILETLRQDPYPGFAAVTSALLLVLFFLPWFRSTEVSAMSGFTLPFRLTDFTDMFPCADVWLPSSGFSILVLLYLAPLCAIWSVFGAFRDRNTFIIRFLSGFLFFYFFSFLLIRYHDAFFERITIWAGLLILLSIGVMVLPIKALHLRLTRDPGEESGPVISRQYRGAVLVVALLLIVPFLLPHGPAEPETGMTAKPEPHEAETISAEIDENRVLGEDEFLAQQAKASEKKLKPSPHPRTGRTAKGKASPEGTAPREKDRKKGQPDEKTLVENMDITRDPLADKRLREDQRNQAGYGPSTRMTDPDAVSKDINQKKKPPEEEEEKGYLHYSGVGSVTFTIDNIKATIGQIRKVVPEYQKSHDVKRERKEALIIDIVLENVTSRSILVLRNIWDNVRLIDGNGGRHNEYKKSYPEANEHIVGKLQSTTLNARSKIKDTMIFPIPGKLNGTLTVQGDPGYFHSTDAGIIEISHKTFGFEFTAEDIR